MLTIALGGERIDEGMEDHFYYVTRCGEKWAQPFRGPAQIFNPSNYLTRLRKSTNVTDVIEEYWVYKNTQSKYDECQL